ncbi:hypothetical protein H7H82_14230 [Mycobacterium heidelbergense]|uniref:hypothetical protein n=1 Tax=Mycobacterium heidelbergense TaxID=53376 RepID=UPI00114E7D27|nr:hypothetical protein [Mycobacterium heidelbergense]MCV7051737.1 hypothetical protein [Mycobacterium heidelbergense]
MKDLLVDTLERSSDVPAGSVATALLPLDGLAPTIAASGAAAETPFILVAGDLRLEIYIIGGDEAFTIEENLAPVPGGASAPNTWALYIQPPGHLLGVVTGAVKDADHLKVGPPTGPGAKQQAAATTGVPLRINESALRRLGGAQ